MLVGWDGADWRLLQPLMDKGLMPALQQLVANGFAGKLASCEPMISPILWTSIATGVRAYQHGINGFIEAIPTGGGVRPIRASQRKVPAVWNILNAHQKRTHVVGWWPSFPAEQLQGVVVSNFYAMPERQTTTAWPLMPEAVFPPSIASVMADLQVHPTELTDAILRPFFPDAGPLDEQDEVLQSVAKILAHTVSVHNAITHALETDPWDFAAVYYNGFDHFLHLANRYHPPQMPEVTDADFEKYHYIITATCRFFDMMLERLLELAGPDAHILLVSDHGFDTDQQRKPQLPQMPGAPALEHQPYGIVAGMGPQWKKGTDLFGASLLDVAPTILQLFDCPLASYFEGRVWEEIFLQKPSQKTVAAYPYVPAYAHPADLHDTENDTALLTQLEALGYIAPQTGENSQNVAAALLENQFYLAAACCDGRKYAEALEILQSLVLKAPGIPRYHFLLLHTALQAGAANVFQKYFQQLQALPLRTDPRTKFYEGLWHLNQQAPMAAFACFEALLVADAHRPGLLYQAGHALLQAQAFDKALDYLVPASELRATHPQTWLDLGTCYAALNRTEDAVSAYINATNCNYALPEAHRHLGQLFFVMGHHPQAQLAFEVALQLDPNNLGALHALLGLYNTLGLVEKAAATTAKLAVLENPIVVVSGLPRSGTSMCMQMLAAGGLQIFEDAERPADLHNPVGYLEHKAVKSLGADARFLAAAKGKAIKIVAPLVKQVPEAYAYRVIYMKRPVAEVVVSQEKMRGKSAEAITQQFPFALAMKLETASHQTLTALHKHPNVAILELEYHEVLKDPLAAAVAIGRFLERKLDHQKMVAAVAPESYRSRLDAGNN